MKIPAIKRSYLLLGAVPAVLSIFALVYSHGLPATVPSQVTLVNYSDNGLFNYAVALLPSYLLGPTPEPPSTTEPPTQSDLKYPAAIHPTPEPTVTTTPTPIQSNLKYPAADIDRFRFTFSYQFTADRAVGIASTQMKATASGRDADGKALTLNLLQTPSMSGSSIKTVFDLVPSQLYGDILVQVEVYATVQTDQGPIFESFTQTLNIKDDGQVLELGRGGQQTQSGYLGSLGYTQTGNLTYVVMMKASSPLGSITLTPPPTPTPTATPLPLPEPPGTVPTVDHFRFTFSYQFTADRAVGVASTQINATASGRDADGKALTLNLLQTPSMSGSSIKTVFDLVPSQLYGDILVQVEVYATVQTDQGPIFESFTQTLNIKDDGQVLELGRGGQQTQSGYLGSVGYTQTGNLTYVVVLKQGSPMGGTTLTPPPTPTPTTAKTVPGKTIGPADTAFLNLIDTMSASFQFQFIADKPVRNLTEQASVDAVLEGTDVWSKTINLVPLTSETGNFSLKFPVDINGLKELVDQIKTETGGGASAYTLTIRVNLHVTGETDYGAVDETFSPQLSTPLDTGELQWAEKMAQTKAGSITTSQVISNPNRYLGMGLVDFKVVSVLATVIFLLVFALLLVLYFLTRTPETASRFDLEHERIKKKYGDRIVESSAAEPRPEGNTISLGSFDGLVRIADELGKPIIYRVVPPPDDGYIYYVLDGQAVYQYINLRTPYRT